MKKTLVCLLFLFSGLLCGCEKTPEKEVVLSKVDGLPEGTVVLCQDLVQVKMRFSSS